MKKLMLFSTLLCVLLSCGSGNENHDWVDLGLPSGTKWATCNIGASNPEDHGDYFAWGETSPKLSYTERNYKKLDKQIDDIAGKREYDAARANWGGKWHTPTREQLEELFKYCSLTFSIDENGSGSNGYRLTGPNGKSIFLPAAGMMDGEEVTNADSYGFYWCSTSHEGVYAGTSAYCPFFNIRGVNFGWDSYYRGHSIRPVLDK